MSTGIQSVSSQNQYLTKLEKVGVWMREHPTTMKVLKIALPILGIGLLASLPFTAPFLGAGLLIGLAITGSLLTLSSAVGVAALSMFELYIPPHHDMKHHMYKPGQCEGGKLYYEGDVPVLTLDSKDPFKAGKAHGYLCGDAIHRLSKRFNLVLHTIARMPRAEKLIKTLNELRTKIPVEYLREMEGLVEGYNKWAEEQPWWSSPKKLTVDDVLLFHLMPDSCHFQPGAYECGEECRIPQNALAVACSALVDRDSKDGFVMARNMDWPSFGLAGAYSLIINRKHGEGLYNTVEVGVPGFIGTLTGMNSEGLSAAMNVCSGDTKEMKGMPAAIYNRECLKRCRNVKEVGRFVQNNAPLGPYHLTTADPNEAKSIHFYQAPDGSHLIRSWEEKTPLVTLNCSFSPKHSKVDMHHSSSRNQLLQEFFQTRKGRPLEDALTLPFVNNFMTTHRVVMKPKTRSVELALDDAFAGSVPLHNVPTQKLFEKTPV